MEMYFYFTENCIPHLGEIAEKALELLQAGCHPPGVLAEQSVEVEHGVVGELAVGLRHVAAGEGAEEGVD